MMDLYEAIELMGEVVDEAERRSTYFTSNPPDVTLLMDEDVFEAMKICLEAARDKAGV